MRWQDLDGLDPCAVHRCHNLAACSVAIGTRRAERAADNQRLHGQCACDLRNPEGTCCLGNVRALMASL